MANVDADEANDGVDDEVRAYLIEAGIPAEVADRNVVLADQPGLQTFVDLVETSWPLGVMSGQVVQPAD